MHAPFNRRQFLHLGSAALAGAGLGLGVSAHAQAWPSKAVRVIVPFTPGGSTDIAARLVATQLTQKFGQSFVVDNRPGAGGNIGLEALARSAPDGYTLGIVTTAHPINMSLYKRTGYDLAKDIQAVGFLQEGPIMVVVHPSLPVNTLPELIAYAKANPGKLNYATSGTGNSTHMAGELFSDMASVKMTHVPYKGSAPAMADTIAGVCQLSFDTMISALPHVKGGKLRALAVTTHAASPLLPDVPPVARTLPGYAVSAWNGVAAPMGIPADILAKLNQGVDEAVKSTMVKTRFAEMGVSSREMTPAQFQAFIAQESAQWAKTVKQAGMTLE